MADNNNAFDVSDASELAPTPIAVATKPQLPPSKHSANVNNGQYIDAGIEAASTSALLMLDTDKQNDELREIKADASESTLTTLAVCFFQCFRIKLSTCRNFSLRLILTSWRVHQQSTFLTAALSVCAVCDVA